MGNLKGVDGIYPQTFVDTYSKVAFYKFLYQQHSNSLLALNDKVLPFFAEQELAMLRMLTDRSTAYCGRVDQDHYPLYLAINDIDHTKTKAISPQTYGICAGFHKTIWNEFYQMTFCKKRYTNMEDLQKDLDDWMEPYNNESTHQGKMCCDRHRINTGN